MIESTISEQESQALKRRLKVSVRKNQIRAFSLVSPVLFFLCLAFVFPIFDMLSRSVDNSPIIDNLPRTIPAISEWDGEGIPDEPVFRAILADLKIARENRSIGKLAARLNYEFSGMRSFLNKTGRKLKKYDESEVPVGKDYLISIDEDWGNPEVWQVLKRESSKYTSFFYIDALDLTYSYDSKSIEFKPEEEGIYMPLFFRTFWMSVFITFLTFILGYPIAYLLSNIPLRYANLLMILVLLPFWTSLLARTSTWIAVLQSHGVLNELMIAAGIISEDNRVQLIHNSTGTFIAMTHILLPFMILPLFSVMKTINPSYVRAARSLGANSFRAFFKVYFPLTLSGVGAGGVLVFILSIGYYITPALVGGQSGRFITNMIAYHMSNSLNWGLAAALASILLFFVVVLYFIYSRFANISDIKFG